MKKSKNPVKRESLLDALCRALGKVDLGNFNVAEALHDLLQDDPSEERLCADVESRASIPARSLRVTYLPMARAFKAEPREYVWLAIGWDNLNRVLSLPEKNRLPILDAAFKAGMCDCVLSSIEFNKLWKEHAPVRESKKDEKPLQTRVKGHKRNLTQNDRETATEDVLRWAREILAMQPALGAKLTTRGWAVLGLKRPGKVG